MAYGRKCHTVANANLETATVSRVWIQWP